VHRTTTTATLLVTVAVSALSGCMTVQLPAPAEPSAALSRPSAPRPDDDRPEPQIVQAPAREALEMIAPSDAPDPTAPASHRPSPVPTEPASPARKPGSRRSHPGPRHPDHPKPRRPDLHVPARPHIEASDVPEPARKDTRGNADVCALGKKYGGWRPDSPEASMCRQTYGR
jgi:hypothetical protein